MNRHLSPDGVAPPAAVYALAVLAEAPPRMLHTSGIVPTRPDGTVPATITEQAGVVWASVGALLIEAEMEIADIVSVTTYVVPGQPLADVMRVRDEFMAGHLAASTLVTVAALARPGWFVEIAVVAARP